MVPAHGCITTGAQIPCQIPSSLAAPSSFWPKERLELESCDFVTNKN